MSVDISTAASTLLQHGNIFGAIMSMFNGIGIESGFIYAMIMVMFSFLVYVRTKNITATGTFLFILGAAGAFANIPGDFGKYFFGVMFLGAAVAFFGVVSDRF